MPVTVLGTSGAMHAGVGDDDDVGVEAVAALVEQVLEVRRAGLLLALDEQLERDRRACRARSPRGARAARAGGTAADPCRRTHRAPAARRRRRSGRTGRCATAPADRPAARRGGRRRARSARRRRRCATRRTRVGSPAVGQISTVGKPSLRERVGQPLGAARDVGVVFGLSADAGDPQPGVEIVEQVLAVVGDEVAYCGHIGDDSRGDNLVDMDADVVIVGAGLAGSAAAWALSQRGRSVVLLEQFAPGHTSGSSHGSARIVRRAYGDGLYTTLTGRAFELWREVEQQSGEQILRIYGGLDFGPRRNVDDRRRAPRRRRRAARGAARRRGRAALAGHALRGRRRAPRPGRDDGRRAGRVDDGRRSPTARRAVRDRGGVGVAVRRGRARRRQRRCAQRPSSSRPARGSAPLLSSFVDAAAAAGDAAADLPLPAPRRRRSRRGRR